MSTSLNVKMSLQVFMSSDIVTQEKGVLIGVLKGEYLIVTGVAREWNFKVNKFLESNCLQAIGLLNCNNYPNFDESEGLIKVINYEVILFDRNLHASNDLTIFYIDFMGLQQSLMLLTSPHCVEVILQAIAQHDVAKKCSKGMNNMSDWKVHYQTGTIQSRFFQLAKVSVNFATKCRDSLIKLPWLCSFLLCSEVIIHLLSGLQSFVQITLLQQNCRLQWLRAKILFSNFLINTFLGIVIMLLCLPLVDEMAPFVNNSAHSVAENLKKLLVWMQGAPAGLKLNLQLAQLMGTFFLYHIYLWQGYLLILNSWLSFGLRCWCFAGILGFSVQISLAQDLLSVLTLHVYCFYVYAARVYRFQVYLVLVLWGLFRGKRWNVERKMMEPCLYKVDQLFLGTLSFTILLFLLPTTTLFYGVFTMFRIFLLLLQGFLTLFLRLLFRLPPASLLLRLFRKRTIAATLTVNVMSPAVAGRPLVLSINLKPASISQLCSLVSSKPLFTRRFAFGKFLRDILAGQLVYPWVKSS